MTADVPNKVNRSQSTREDIRVEQVKNHVEVIGLSVRDVKEAIELAQKVDAVRTDTRRALEDYLNKTLLESDEDLMSSATQRQVKRTAALRQSLLTDHGAQTHESLAAVRDSQSSSVRAWVARARERGELFTVKVKGRILIPQVQLNAEGNLDQKITALVRPLLQAGLDSWSLWAWLTSPTGRLSGKTPADVAQENPARARKAADLYAADLERSRDAAE